MAQARATSEKADKSSSASSNFTATALRGFGQLCDMQAAATRIMLRTQMSAASAFGLPNYSQIFEIGDERVLHLCSSATENLARAVSQTDSTLAEIPAQACRLFEQQAIDLTERWKYGLEELQQQASESMEEIKAFSRQQAEELAKTSESIRTATQSALREGGEQFRAAVHQSRELAARQSEAMRKEGERVAGDVQEAAEGGEQLSRSRHSRAA